MLHVIPFYSAKLDIEEKDILRYDEHMLKDRYSYEEALKC